MTGLPCTPCDSPSDTEKSASPHAQGDKEAAVWIQESCNLEETQETQTMEKSRQRRRRHFTVFFSLCCC